MSKNINVNPGQYKVRGRERQGEDIPHDYEKQRLALSERNAPRAPSPTKVRDRAPKSTAKKAARASGGSRDK
jgi:hypothetical protein